MGKARKPHSAEYFGESRDFWWNPDFMALMAARWRLAEVRAVLDAGCGVGHWGRVLAPFLSPQASVVGVDRESEWVAKAAATAESKGLSGRFTYQQAVVENLPFEDARFDLVTCQTLLIHVAEPRAVLKEFLRVLKPGGLLVLSEPNNLANALARDSATFDGPVDVLMDAVRLQTVCERGKAALGLGNNSVGDMLPAYLNEFAVEDFRVYLSDKASFILPGSSSPGQAAALAQTEDWLSRDFWIWDKAETESYYRAGGGLPADFERLFANAMAYRRVSFDAAKAGRLCAVEAGLQYLISARKPAR